MIPGAMYAVSQLYAARQQEWNEWQAKHERYSRAKHPVLTGCSICHALVRDQFNAWLGKQPGSLLWPTNRERYIQSNSDWHKRHTGYGHLQSWAPPIEDYARGPRMPTTRAHQVNRDYCRYSSDLPGWKLGNSDLV